MADDPNTPTATEEEIQAAAKYAKFVAEFGEKVQPIMQQLRDIVSATGGAEFAIFVHIPLTPERFLTLAALDNDEKIAASVEGWLQGIELERGRVQAVSHRNVADERKRFVH